MTRTSRKQREEQQRAEILSAAERMFSSKGFYQTTMRDIAKVAEFGVGTVYKFFSSKERLYLAVIENKMQELIDEMKQKVAEVPDALNKIKTFVQIWLEFFAKNKDLFRLLTTELDEQRLCVRKRLRERIFKQHSELIEVVNRAFKEAIKKRLIKKYEIDLLAHAIGGMTKDLIVHKLIKGEAIDPKKDAETIFEIFAYGVLKTKGDRSKGS